MLVNITCILLKMFWRSGDKVALGAVVPSITITINVMYVDFEERHVGEAE